MASSTFRSFALLLLVLFPLPARSADVAPEGDPRVTLIVDYARVEARLHEALRRRFTDVLIRRSLEQARVSQAEDGGFWLAIEVSTTREVGEICPYGQCLPTCHFTATAEVFRLPADLEFSALGEGRAQDCGSASEKAATSLLNALSPRLESYLIHGDQPERDYLWVELPDMWSEDELAELRSDLLKVPGIVGIEPDWDDHLIKLEVYLETRTLAGRMDKLESFRVNRFAGRRVTLGALRPEPLRPAEEPPGSKSQGPIEPPFQLPSSLAEDIPSLPFSGGRKWALVIGVSSFEDESISGLSYPARDAEAFAEVLAHREIGRFSSNDVVVLLDGHATTRRIKMELDYLARQTQPEDLFLFFISTHAVPGAFDTAGDAYLVTHDTEKAGLYATGLPMRELVDALTHRIRARTVVGILDACHTGQIVERTQDTFEEVRDIAQGPSPPASRLSWEREWTELSAKSVGMGPVSESLPSDQQPKRIVFISSSDGYQPSWESEELGHGFFTYFLMEALRQSQGGLTLKSLYDVLKVEVRRAVLVEKGKLQEPQMFFTEDADFPIGYETQPE